MMKIVYSCILCLIIASGICFASGQTPQSDYNPQGDESVEKGYRDHQRDHNPDHQPYIVDATGTTVRGPDKNET